MCALLFEDGGLIQLRKYRAQLHGLQQENHRLRQSHSDYLETINKLRTDPYEIERIAREQYNRARPGDTIVNLQE
ncbi:septum formation initiator family protein [Streptococcus pseudopneumoniae]|uniref:FtsB family cell division protein n=1 Tax=Streptococcus pseudopneumoniae TaxID=257758 RepID=UPI00148686ED